MSKIRWDVDAANGRIKKWLNNVARYSQIPYIGEFVRIVCIMICKFRLTLQTSDDGDLRLGYKMLIESRENANALKQLSAIDTHAFRANSKSWKRNNVSDVVC